MKSATAKIRDLAQIRAGYQTRKAVKEIPSGSHFLIQIRDFNEDRTLLNTRDLARVEPGPINEQQVLREGDVLFLAKGARNFAVVASGLPKPVLASSYFFILRPGRRIDPGYLVWFLNLDTTKKLLSRQAGTSAHMPVVRREVLEDLELPLPDLETQRKVVELDRLMRRQQQLLSELAEARKVLFTQAAVRLANQTFSSESSHE